MPDERFQTLLKQLTLLVGNKYSLDNEQAKEIMDFALQKVMQDVANYCNIPVQELPAELDKTIVAMALQLLDTHGWLVDSNSPQNVESLTEGDTSISLKSPADVYQELQTINTISDNYVQILNCFRKLPL